MPPPAQPPALPVAAPQADARAAPAGPGQLFVAFTRLALQGFGGVLAVAQIERVVRLGWLTREDFLELLSVSQVLPGPNSVNLGLMVGDRYFGLRGALAAVAGLLTVPLVLVLTLAALYGRWAHLPAVAGALRGMGAVAAGLVIAMGLKLLPALRKSPLGALPAALVCVATFGGVALLQLPLIWIIGGLGGASVALAWWRLR